MVFDLVLIDVEDTDAGGFGANWAANTAWVDVQNAVARLGDATNVRMTKEENIASFTGKHFLALGGVGAEKELAIRAADVDRIMADKDLVTSDFDDGF